MNDADRARERVRLTEMGLRPDEIERQFDPAISDATKAAEVAKVLMRTFQPVFDTPARRRKAAAVGRRIYENVVARFFPGAGEARRRRRRRRLSMGVSLAVLVAGLTALLILR